MQAKSALVYSLLIMKSLSAADSAAKSAGALQACRRALVAPGCASEEDAMRTPYETHRAQLKAILLAWGMPQDNAETTADILSWADLHGVDSHGISMIPGYDRLRRAGRANMKARPHIISETPVSALVDGDGGLGHVPARFAMQVAIDKAKLSGWRSPRCAIRHILAPLAITH